MKSISGYKDTDREILLKMDDENFLKTCNLNNYFKNEVCNDNFFKKRLQEKYPDTLELNEYGNDWKRYFLEVVYYISKLKEEFNYDYYEGDPLSIYIDLQETFVHPVFLNQPLIDFLLKSNFGNISGTISPLRNLFEHIVLDYHILSRDIVAALLEIYEIENGYRFEEGYYFIGNELKNLYNYNDEKLTYDQLRSIALDNNLYKTVISPLESEYLVHPQIKDVIFQIRQIVREKLKEITHRKLRQELKNDLFKRRGINDATNIND